MQKYSTEQLVREALAHDPKTIGDRLYLIAWVWARYDHDPKTPEFAETFGELYTYLLKHPDPDTIIRTKEKILEGDPVLKAKAKDTSYIRAELRVGQQNMGFQDDEPPLGFDEARKRLAVMIGKLETSREDAAISASAEKQRGL